MAELIRMNHYTDAQLELMMTDLESDCVERKQSFQGDAPQKVREAVCAFANDLSGRGKPGVVFIGVDDQSGLCVEGFQVTDRLLLQLADIKSDGNIVPPPSLFVEKKMLCGAEVAVITVWPCDTPPVRFKGRIHVRWGPRRGLATAQDERILNERRRYHDKPFDIQPTSAKLADLSRVRFEHEYLPALVAPDVIEANERNYEQKLAATKMTVSDVEAIPTVLGVLTLANKPSDFIPGAYGQFVRFSGADAASEILDEATIVGTISEQIRRMEEKCAAHNVRSVRFVDVPVEERSEGYPTEALQQLIRNAYLHRSYENTNAPVRVYWFVDRIEISSPGGPYGSVTCDNFGQPGLADYRNPNLAEAMRAQGWVQRFGAGLVIARKLLGERLSFSAQPTMVFAKIQFQTGKH